jgi:hypothetical protein
MPVTPGGIIVECFRGASAARAGGARCGVDLAGAACDECRALWLLSDGRIIFSGMHSNDRATSSPSLVACTATTVPRHGAKRW